MKKTIPTSIANTLFYIEEDTYQKLDNYLSEIRKYFSSYKDKKEIIEDIESRIREQFMEYCAQDKTERIVTSAHVDKLIKTMGWPKEFGEFGEFGEKENAHQKETSDAGTSAKTRKRLYRDKDHAVIGGVAAGLAAYFGIDPVIVRIVFVIATVSGGVGIPVYIVLWFAVPAAETTTEKLEMQGEPVNLDEVKKMVEEKMSDVRGNENIKHNAKNFFEGVRNIIIKLAKMLFKIISRVIGVGCKIVSVVGVAALLVLLGTALIPGSGTTWLTPYHPLPYFDIFVALFFVLGLMPLIFLNKLGNLFLGRKMFGHPEYPGVGFVVWLTALIVAIVLFVSVQDAYVSTLKTQTPQTEWRQYNYNTEYYR